MDWPIKSDDFFPYASSSYAIWSGYYTSRPTSKRFERLGNHFLQISKQLSALTMVRESLHDDKLNRLRQIMGVMQHHDAITGTERQFVAEDYHKELHASIVGCGDVTRSSLNQLMSDTRKFEFSSCLNLNISRCDVSESSEKFMVTVYNPLAHGTSQHVRFPVAGGSYEVIDPYNVEVPAQIVPISKAMMNQTFYRLSNTTNELVFAAEDVPAMGFKAYFITRTSPQTRKLSAERVALASTTIGNDDFRITFNASGFLSTITIDGETSRLSQNFLFYQEVGGANLYSTFRAAGAYTLRPFYNETGRSLTQKVELEVVRGAHVDEIHQKFNDWISQVVRVYKNERFVEFEWLVGPIPEDRKARSIISRFTTDINTEGEFFTDLNGREMMKRRRNKRDTWDVKLKERIPGNYYPVTTKIAIQDERHRLAVLTDRSQGGSSMFDGTLELMVS